MKEKTEKKKLLKPSVLAEKTGLRVSTIKFWTQEGLLPYEQGGARLMRRYPEREAIKRISEILKLKEKRLTLPEIKEIILGGNDE